MVFSSRLCWNGELSSFDNGGHGIILRAKCTDWSGAELMTQQRNSVKGGMGLFSHTNEGGWNYFLNIERAGFG